MVETSFADCASVISVALATAVVTAEVPVASEAASELTPLIKALAAANAVVS